MSDGPSPFDAWEDPDPERARRAQNRRMLRVLVLLAVAGVVVLTLLASATALLR